MDQLILLVPLLLLGWLFLSQRRRQQRMREAQSQIEPGAQVATTSGLIGTLVSLDADEAVVEAAPGVHLRFDRRAIVPRAQVAATAPSGAAQSDTGAGTAATAPVSLDKHDDAPSAAAPSTTSGSTTGGVPSAPAPGSTTPETKAD